MTKNNKQAEFQINEVLGLVILLGVTGIGAAFAASVQGEIRDEFATSNCAEAGGFYNVTSSSCQANTTNTTQIVGNDAATNVSVDGLNGIANITTRMGSIGLIIAAVIIITLLGRLLRNR